MIRSLWNDNTSPEMHCKPTFGQQKDVSFFPGRPCLFPGAAAFPAATADNEQGLLQNNPLRLSCHSTSSVRSHARLQLTPMQCHAYKPPSQEYGSCSCGIPTLLRPLSPNSTHPFFLTLDSTRTMCHTTTSWCQSPCQPPHAKLLEARRSPHAA